MESCLTFEIVLQVDMPPQQMLYYVPAQRGWVKNEVEELIEVCSLCLCKPVSWEGCHRSGNH